MPSSTNDSSCKDACSEKLLWIKDKSDSESEEDLLEMIDMMNNFLCEPDSDNTDSDGFNNGKESEFQEETK